MIDIKDVDTLELKAIEDRIIQERKNQELAKLALDRIRSDNIDKAMKAKIKSETMIPSELKKIEDSIKQAIQCNKRVITYYGPSFESYRNENKQIIWFLYITLIPMLMLNGFVCSIEEGKLNISW